MALVRRGTLLVVGDSNRFDATGRSSSLAVINVAKAPADRPALIGYLPAERFPRDMTLALDGQLLIASYLAGRVEQVDTAQLTATGR
jgi:hypothetical protein